MRRRHPSTCRVSQLGRFHLARLLAVCLIGSLAACAAQPITRHVKLRPVEPAVKMASFAIAPGHNDASRQVAALVEQKLKTLGHINSDLPDYLVEVSVMSHPASTGALIPSTEPEAAYVWTDRPNKRYQKSKMTTLVLRIRFLDPETGAPMILTTTRLVSSNISISDSGKRMVDAMFATDPLAMPETNPSMAR